jgi:prepilin peptidase CpaA
MLEEVWFPSVMTLLVVTGVAIVDYTRFRIPNTVTLPFGLAGIGFYAVAAGWPGLVFSLAGLALGFILLFAPYALGGFGGGDVKLLTATGAWLGAQGVLQVFLISAILLGCVSLYLILREPAVRRAAWMNLRMTFAQLHLLGRLLESEEQVRDVVQREDRRQRAVPYGVVLALGLAAMLAWKTLQSWQS